jgi:hypothetical protein
MDSPETLSKDEIALRKAQHSAEKAILNLQEVQAKSEQANALQASREQSRLEVQAIFLEMQKRFAEFKGELITLTDEHDAQIQAAFAPNPLTYSNGEDCEDFFNGDSRTVPEESIEENQDLKNFPEELIEENQDLSQKSNAQANIADDEF